MIIEGIVITTNAEGQAHLSPMGPVIDLQQQQIELRPFGGSVTLSNLIAHPYGVFHCTDDALMIVQAVTKRWVEEPQLVPAQSLPGWVLPAACVWHEFACGFVDQSSNRAVVLGKIRHTGRGPDFAGFNRAKHGLIEAAITISRLQFLPAEEIEQSLQVAARLVDKTGSSRERLALDLLQTHFAEHQLAQSTPNHCNEANARQPETREPR